MVLLGVMSVIAQLQTGGQLRITVLVIFELIVVALECSGRWAGLIASYMIALIPLDSCRFGTANHLYVPPMRGMGCSCSVRVPIG